MQMRQAESSYIRKNSFYGTLWCILVVISGVLVEIDSQTLSYGDCHAQRGVKHLDFVSRSVFFPSLWERGWKNLSLPGDLVT